MLRAVRTTTTLPLVRKLWTISLVHIVGILSDEMTTTARTYRFLLNPSSPVSLKNCRLPCMRLYALTASTPAP